MIFGVVTVAFLLMHITPGDPAVSYLGDRTTPKEVAALHHQWGARQALDSKIFLIHRRIVDGEPRRSLVFQDIHRRPSSQAHSSDPRANDPRGHHCIRHFRAIGDAGCHT
ncbi:hypothetical protein [Bifidobacterium moukalabense]|uniref:hypothetical protein n=1 Tax=Bifidobacterium moukalabense TaxID=1333651 RepID=UPI003530C36B